ncbi:uncharacterized protein BT62DRAFT_925475 [Guyanagaster necrorhizus]|uniref:Histone chaperone RTT106/FACT complex subunit SPT16-like middle domain-containing protein n=1 Tax=Guyanagaster necrorhizus TaxID=856835 RepID=A0A9P8AZ54_9AGAR|nr:uncharacterized protein BT62DRAFT_925475 [Guyanagaster necrorhizus MCA 3950]KAG7452931.1 hypothetical protein BT62DRAFT_925475 [Guyanagaster necrorhizus MCA 3950]
MLLMDPIGLPSILYLRHHRYAKKFVVPASQAAEAVVPLSQLSRAFILPTRGKTKPHWTVVIISTNTTEKGASSPQIIFGLDASAPSPLSTTDSTSVKKVLKKGDPTLPAIKDFLSYLRVPILQPSTDVFKSACTKGSDGCPGIEAYLGAKVGSLWFMKEGILWGESKPCEFWPVEDLMGKTDGLKMISATGRTCTLILMRRSTGDPEEEEEDTGEETAFSLIDGKEQDGINQWVKRFQSAFGKKKGEGSRPASLPATGKMTIMQIGDESDEDDEDFKDEEQEEEEEVTSDSSDGEGGGSGGDMGSEEDKDAQGSNNEDASGDEDEGVLKEENHPLLRPGAMPRMSRAAIDMVVGMVEEDMLGGDEDEEDELDD